MRGYIGIYRDIYGLGIKATMENEMQNITANEPETGIVSGLIELWL